MDDVVAHHESVSGPRHWTGARERRNLYWSTWLRRPLPKAIRLTMGLAIHGNSSGVRGLIAAVPGIPWVVREHRVVPLHVEQHLRLLERAGSHP